ncbi:serine/threonine-protein kinase [Nocardioides aurantiacus]|uniref:non-specific serine/threonine protein kinase n=1 Tax=Nocardioides aurantiacus TaxID=86796 RepID=A0A3N2CS32_9ACTN|nr:serine/threonine-protein kinase [Nocardioides aurantiacus]ROR90352.1 serine/threonine protein kinase [Nocardioides aurantiacus]
MTHEDSWDFEAGDQVTPELGVVERLGGGASCEAYLCFDEVTHGPVVVKVLRPDRVGEARAARSLEREAEALRTVNHPVVVRLLRDGRDDPRPHLVLEAADGPRLSSLLRRHGPLQPEQYLPLGIDLASAAAYLRHVGHVHLDVKPGNVVMGAPARLIDLSAARPVAEAAALLDVVGTDAYLAPEQCLPGQVGVPGPASDVWGIGATLFEAAAGYRPFDEGDPAASAPEAVWPQLEQVPYDVPRAVPATVADALLACLARRPEDRPTPAELSDALAPTYAALPKGRLAGFRVR